jgi:hypothetical protein
MQPSQRRQLNELLQALITLIIESTVDDTVMGKARAIVDYYLTNPFTKRKDDFFNQLTVAYRPSHEHAADPRYVPFLSLLLYSNHQMLIMRLEALDAIAGLPFKPETIQTKEELQNRFVEALAKYTEIDHTDFEAMSTLLTMQAFGCNSPLAFGELKDLPT